MQQATHALNVLEDDQHGWRIMKYKLRISNNEDAEDLLAHLVLFVECDPVAFEDADN